MKMRCGADLVTSNAVDCRVREQVVFGRASYCSPETDPALSFPIFASKPELSKLLQVFETLARQEETGLGRSYSVSALSLALYPAVRDLH